MLPDATIERGPRLTDCTVPCPVTLDDGTIVILDSGTLRTVDRELNDRTMAKLMSIQQGQGHRFISRMELHGDQLEIKIKERSEEPPYDYTTFRWTYQLTR